MLKIEVEREEDGRWVAEAPALPGVLAYGSHAIFVSDFQDLCYSLSWFPKRPRARPEARRAWTVGRLLRSGRGSILVARRCGGASSAHARRRRG